MFSFPRVESRVSCCCERAAGADAGPGTGSAVGASAGAAATGAGARVELGGPFAGENLT